MHIEKLIDELNSYEKGVVQKLVKGKRKELIKGVATTLSEIIFYNGTVANVRITSKGKVVSIEYQGRVILDYDEVSFNVKAKARQIIKMMLKSGKSEKVILSEFSEKTATRIEKERDELILELKALEDEIASVRDELNKYKKEII